MMNLLFSLLFNEMMNTSGLDEVKGLTKEEVVYDKGDFKTTIVHYFSSDGYMVGVKTTSEPKEPDPAKQLENLHSQKKEAIEKEDYILASRINKEIKELEEKNKT